MNNQGKSQQKFTTKAVLWAFILLLAVAFWPRLYDALTWNLANVLSVHARLADSSGEMYQKSTQAATILKRLQQTALIADDDVTKGIQTIIPLQWRSASALGLVEPALKLYEEMVEKANRHENVDCIQAMPHFFEAATFNGVTDSGLARPRYVGNSTNSGAILFSTTPAITQRICIKKAGLYVIGIAAAESTPPPIQIEVKWDEWDIGTIEYGRGDNQIRTKKLQVVIPPGEYELSLRFVNDLVDYATGADRNALIDHVEILGY